MLTNNIELIVCFHFCHFIGVGIKYKTNKRQVERKKEEEKRRSQVFHVVRHAVNGILYSSGNRIGRLYFDSIIIRAVGSPGVSRDTTENPF